MVTKYKLFSSLVAYLQSFFLEHAASFILHLPADSGTKCTLHLAVNVNVLAFCSLDFSTTSGIGCIPSYGGDCIFFL
jgi:hypothetical protein